jgi:hypothetical protein
LSNSILPLLLLQDSRGFIQYEAYADMRAFLILSRQSGCTFYPSGRICTCASYTKSGMYVWFYADDDASVLLGCISPVSGGTFFRASGQVRALYTPLHFVAFDEEGIKM